MPASTADERLVAVCQQRLVQCPPRRGQLHTHDLLFLRRQRPQNISLQAAQQVWTQQPVQLLDLQLQGMYILKVVQVSRGAVAGMLADKTPRGVVLLRKKRALPVSPLPDGHTWPPRLPRRHQTSRGPRMPAGGTARQCCSVGGELLVKSHFILEGCSRSLCETVGDSKHKAHLQWCA